MSNWINRVWSKKNAAIDYYSLSAGFCDVWCCLLVVALLEGYRFHSRGLPQSRRDRHGQRDVHGWCIRSSTLERTGVRRPDQLGMHTIVLIHPASVGPYAESNTACRQLPPPLLRRRVTTPSSRLQLLLSHFCRGLPDLLRSISTCHAWSRYPHMPIGKVWIYRLLFVCLFVCTVTDFSVEHTASGVKFCTAVHRRPTQGISPIFGNFASPEAKNRTNLPALGPRTPLQYLARRKIGMCAYRSVPTDALVLIFCCHPPC